MHENRETSETPAVLADSRSAGEGSGRTARMYVSEESHRGIVPMNHSNKDRASSAESEEGRLRLQENTLSSDTYPTQCGTARVPRVRECARSEMLGRHSPARRTGCANERPSGSVRGAPGNWCPYRDLMYPGSRNFPVGHLCNCRSDSRLRPGHPGCAMVRRFKELVTLQKINAP